MLLEIIPQTSFTNGAESSLGVEVEISAVRASGGRGFALEDRDGYGRELEESREGQASGAGADDGDFWVGHVFQLIRSRGPFGGLRS